LKTVPLAFVNIHLPLHRALKSDVKYSVSYGFFFHRKYA